MAGDPKECRTHALRCSELAKNAKTPEMKKLLLDLAKTWIKLAVELERAQSLLDERAVPGRSPKR
jgi:hypothetical protein